MTAETALERTENELRPCFPAEEREKWALSIMAPATRHGTR